MSRWSPEEVCLSLADLADRDRHSWRTRIPDSGEPWFHLHTDTGQRFTVRIEEEAAT